jgi:hypothetical protein
MYESLNLIIPLIVLTLIECVHKQINQNKRYKSNKIHMQ